MTQIIGGQHFQNVRDGQLHHAETKTLSPSIKSMASAARSRLACYYSQYDLVPVMIKGRVIAYVPGKYLAKIVKSSGACRFIATIDGYIRRGLNRGKSERVVGIFHKQLLILENTQISGEDKP